jgi:hypothetical protein
MKQCTSGGASGESIRGSQRPSRLFGSGLAHLGEPNKRQQRYKRPNCEQMRKGTCFISVYSRPFVVFQKLSCPFVVAYGFRVHSRL